MKNMASPSMLRQHPSYESSPIDDSNMNSKSPYTCYNGTYQYPRNGHENLVYVMPSDSNENQNGSHSNGGEPVTKNAGSRWREDETEALVEIWRDKICQTRWWKQSKGVRVNKEMWEEIAHLLAEREVFRTPAQCQIRMKNLLQFYRQTIDSRRSEKSWEDLPEYFDIVDKIMTRKETSTGGMVTSNLSDSKSYSPGSQSMSPPKLHNEKAYEEEKERVEEMEEERKINTTNKRKSSVRSTEEFNEHPDLDHGKLYYPPTTTSSANCHPPPRKIPAYAMKSEYGGSNPYHAASSIPSNFSRMHHRGEPCSGSCCTKPAPYTSRSGKSTKEKDFNKEQMEPPSALPIPPLEQYNMAPPPPSAQMINLQSEPSNKGGESRNHACNYYTPPQGPPQPPPPHHYRHNYIQLYRGGVAPTADNYAKNAQTHLMFNQDLLQLQYKQMKTLIEIEKKRLEIEEGRMREEKEANCRTSAFLLEAVKILAETFRKEANNNELDCQKQQNSLLTSSKQEKDDQ